MGHSLPRVAVGLVVVGLLAGNLLVWLLTLAGKLLVLPRLGLGRDGSWRLGRSRSSGLVLAGKRRRGLLEAARLLLGDLAVLVVEALDASQRQSAPS